MEVSPMEVSPKVLIVDDNEVFVEALGGALEDIKCVVKSALDIGQAIEALSGNWFDLVLLDVDLKNGTGLEVLQRIRLKSFNHSPSIIIVTARPEMDEIKSMLMYGVHGYIEKSPKSTHSEVIRQINKLFGAVPSPLPDNLKHLTALIKNRHQNNAEGFTLFLGAGVSANSGCSMMNRIVDAYLHHRRNWDIERICTTSWDNKLNEFELWVGTERPLDMYGFLKQHLQGREPSTGIKVLARLIADGYFRTILTTNLDNLLENEIRSRKDGNLQPIVFKSKENTRQCEMVRNSQVPTLLKLHGDLEQQVYLFTSDEIFQFARNLESLVENILSKDIIIIGHSFRDLDLVRCLQLEGGSIWSVNPSPPVSPLTAVMRCRNSRDKFISGLWGQFDNFMRYLDSEL